jgi:hypothetical protein
MLALGTHNGGVHILDFSGHEVRARRAETVLGGDRGTLEGGLVGVAEKLLTLMGAHMSAECGACPLKCLPYSIGGNWKLEILWV